jgi:predicted dehydrogenase
VSSLADLNELISLEKQFGGRCFVDYHKLFDPANLMLRQELQTSLEDLYQVSSVMTQRSDMKEIFKAEIEFDLSFNVNWYIGCHYIHLVSSITKAKPINVRSIGFGDNKVGNSSNYDLIETSISWRTQSGHIFSSNHLAGWGDPSNAPSMSTQKINVITKNSRIYSNQDYRGIEVQKEGKDLSRPNPFFFRLPQVDEGLSGWDSNYGFRSIRSFLDFSKGVSFEEGWIPTLDDSIIVTRILEASDISLKSGSKIIEL